MSANTNDGNSLSVDIQAIISALLIRVAAIATAWTDHINNNENEES